MFAGTVRMGEMMPGEMRPSSPLWQRLYLRPEPHQQSSFDWGRTAGALARARGVDPESLIANNSTNPPFSATLEYGCRLAATKFQSGELLPGSSGSGSNDLFIVKAP